MAKWVMDYLANASNAQGPILMLAALKKRKTLYGEFLNWRDTERNQQKPGRKEKFRIAPFARPLIG